MTLRQLIQSDDDWLNAPSSRRVLQVALAASAGLAVYGFTVGYWRDPLMGAYVAVKLPLLVALTLICNGLLNGLLGLLLGTGLGFRQSLLAWLFLLGFAPAVWIFAESSDSFGFMGTLGVGAWIIAVVFALRFLKSVVLATGGTQKGPLTIWSAVFLLVTLQMTTSLRPILGRSDVLLTQEKKFFLQHWSDQFGKSLTTSTSKAPPPAPTEAAPSRGGRNPYNE